jgi:indolepyruvate ferredoxin oxidoreductase
VPGVSALISTTRPAPPRSAAAASAASSRPGAKRVFINEAVCEGCGDCGKCKSNCLSVVPLETEFGRKRAIDQSTCNKDYSCLKGFCPSFVTVEGGRCARQGGAEGRRRRGFAPPAGARTRRRSTEPYGILVTGVGGTGVITIGALIGMAAHLDGQGRVRCST